MKESAYGPLAVVPRTGLRKKEFDKACREVMQDPRCREIVLSGLKRRKEVAHAHSQQIPADGPSVSSDGGATYPQLPCLPSRTPYTAGKTRPMDDMGKKAQSLSRRVHCARPHDAEVSRINDLSTWCGG